jgi:hypothetical protein
VLLPWGLTKYPILIVQNTLLEAGRLAASLLMDPKHWVAHSVAQCSAVQCSAVHSALWWGTLTMRLLYAVLPLFLIALCRESANQSATLLQKDSSGGLYTIQKYIRPLFLEMPTLHVWVDLC